MGSNNIGSHYSFTFAASLFSSRFHAAASYNFPRRMQRQGAAIYILYVIMVLEYAICQIPRLKHIISTIVPQLWPRWQGRWRPEEVYSDHGSGICCIPDTMIDTCSQEKTQLKDAGFQTYQISAINLQCW